MRQNCLTATKNKCWIDNNNFTFNVYRGIDSERRRAFYTGTTAFRDEKYAWVDGILQVVAAPSVEENLVNNIVTQLLLSILNKISIPLNTNEATNSNVSDAEFLPYNVNGEVVSGEQNNKGIWFDKIYETDAYIYMWTMSVRDDIEYSAHIFKDGVFVQKGIDKATSQPVNSINGKQFGENYYIIGKTKKSLIAHIHTHQSKDLSYVGIRGFSNYGYDDAMIATHNGLTFFGINHYGDFYAGVQSAQGRYGWNYLNLGSYNRNHLLNGNFSIINFMLNGGK